MQLILARHGETAWNVEKVFRGMVDIDLNETGIRQAQLLAGYLGDFPVEAVFSSPLKRALQTAEEIAGSHNLKVQVARGIIDIDFGGWNGLPAAEVESKYPDLYKKWIDSPEDVVFPYGESLDDVKQRALAFVETLTPLNKGIVVLVSHRVVIKAIICALLGLDNSHFWNIRQDTCGITTFSYEDEQFVLAEHNNTSFLKSLGLEKPADF